MKRIGSASFQLLNNLSIPRNVIPIEAPHQIQVHGFSDASQWAYGACIYLRTSDNVGNCIIRLLTAKSKLAPIKPITIPRLELCAALLLTRLVTKVIKSLSVQLNSIHLWSDSRIVLAWVSSPAARWKTFVANRVGEIQETTNNMKWHYVPSEDNPADHMSQGWMPTQLIHNSLWWSGPALLTQNTSQRPDQAYAPAISSNELFISEQRITTASTLQHSNSTNYPKMEY